MRIFALEMEVEAKGEPFAGAGKSKPPPPKCRRTNWPAYNVALKRRGSLDVWFDPEPASRAPRVGRPMASRFNAILILCLRKWRTVPAPITAFPNSGQLALSATDKTSWNGRV